MKPATYRAVELALVADDTPCCADREEILRVCRAGVRLVGADGGTDESDVAIDQLAELVNAFCRRQDAFRISLTQIEDDTGDRDGGAARRS